MEEAAIIFFLILASIAFGRFLKHRQRMEEIASKNSVSIDVKKELSELRDRVATLESIVTDKGYQLKEEIEKLNTGS